MSEFLSFRLPEEFLQEYEGRKPDWGFPIGGGNSLAELTFVTKYSRLKDDGTKERWWEVCRRCVEGYYSILKDHCLANKTPWNDHKAQRSARDAYDRMFTFKWTPPGRGLWMMGTDFVHRDGNSSPLQNCFAGYEKFITKEYGPTRFNEVVGESVTVWTEMGWSAAEVNEFGVQQVQRVSFAPANRHPDVGWRKARSNVRHNVVVTPDHGWVLIDGTETRSLKVGDVVPADAASDDDGGWHDDWLRGAQHGVIFGDGNKITHRYANGDYGLELPAFSDRMQMFILENDFEWDRVDFRPSHDGAPTYCLRSSVDLKGLPTGASPAYTWGFIEGWCQADASESSAADGGWILSTQNHEAADWLIENAASGNFLVVGDSTSSVLETNFGTRSAPLRTMTLRHPGGKTAWKVTSIEVMSEPEPVYCVTVPDVGRFTLASGIYTMNCSFISTEKLSTHSYESATLPFTRLMEMSMLGIGVGFDTRGAGRLSIHVPTGEASEFVVPDTREGWCDSVGALLASYFFKGRRPVVFDYSQVRLAGEPIKGFGGTAAGPDPLRDCHVKLNEILSAQSGEPISSTVIADICNLIAKCVVSGNVRRSALIALGNPDDEDYLNLKNYEVNPERMGPDGWGWTSNNSVFAEVDGDYSHLVDLIADNGEPGLFFMDLARSHGRLVDPPNYRDSRIKGCNPCAEQPLEPWEVCTLVETFPHHHESLEDFKQTLKHAYLYGKAVTLMSTHWPETNEVMQRNRRIGTSVSGLAQFVEARGWTELRKWLDDGYQAIKLRDLQYSEWLGVRESIKTTTVKPSGTVSLVAGATPGVHWPVASGTYIRRIRFSNVDPLLQPLLEAGYKAEADVMNPKTTTVVEFPTTGPDVRTETEVSVWEKAELSVLLQRWWSDNMVSCTLTFQGSEVDQLPALVAAKVGQLKTMSMLPIFESGGAYAQMPYERIDPEKAAELQSLAKPMNWEIVYDTALEAEGDRYCTTDKCEIQ